MSKASQRKEAERRKRLEKQYGAKGAKLVQSLERLGPAAIETAKQVLEIACELGPKQKDTPQRRRLERLAGTLERWVHTLWRSATCFDTEDEEQFGFAVPSMMLFWGATGDDIRASCVPRAMPMSVADAGSEAVVRWMFDHVERMKLEDIEVAMFLVGADHEDGYSAVCLLADRSGTRAARVLSEGSWIRARVPEPCFGLGALAAARASMRMFNRRSVRDLVAEGESVGVGQDADPQALLSTAKAELLQDVMSQLQWPLQELCYRLGMDCLAAEEEAEEAWSIADEIQGAAGEREEAAVKLARLEQQLNDAKAQIRRLSQAQKSTRPSTEALPQVRVEASRGGAAPPQETQASPGQRVVERMSAFF